MQRPIANKNIELRQLLKTLLAFAVIISILWSSEVSTAIADSGDKCRMADRLSMEAQAKMKAEPAAGVKLFTKAQKLCPGSAVNNFNLGLAYFKYGNLKKAAEFMTRAVSLDSKNPQFNNALAWILLENGSDNAKALKHAKISGLQNNAAYRHTLIRAYLANGILLEGIKAAQQAIKRWPKNERIKEIYLQAEDKYIAHYLALAKSGRPSTAIEGLEKLPESGPAVEARCWLLYRSHKTVEALKLAQASKNISKSYQPLKETFDRILDSYIKDRYNQFKSGQIAEAWSAVKAMRQNFPKNKALSETEEMMVAEVIKSTKNTRIDTPQAQPKHSDGGYSLPTMLGEIQKSPASESYADHEIDVDVKIPQGRDRRPDAIAVIIGNKHYANYRNKIPDVDYAQRDAASVCKYLVETLGYNKRENILECSDATKGKLESIFGTEKNAQGKLFNYVKKGKSEVFIYYSGHGAPDLKNGDAYIVPVDADVNYLSNTGYAMKLFYSNIAKLRAKRITIVLDACFSGQYHGGTLVSGLRSAMLKTSNPVEHLTNVTIFSSSQSDQISHAFPDKRHGLFTYFFLKGLGGAADKDDNKQISVAEMRDYLIEEVSVNARRMGEGEQTPVVVAGSGDNYKIVRLR